MFYNGLIINYSGTNYSWLDKQSMDAISIIAGAPIHPYSESIMTMDKDSKRVRLSSSMDLRDIDVKALVEPTASGFLDFVVHSANEIMKKKYGYGVFTKEIVDQGAMF
jgi:hypothetical protein